MCPSKAIPAMATSASCTAVIHHVASALRLLPETASESTDWNESRSWSAAELEEHCIASRTCSARCETEASCSICRSPASASYRSSQALSICWCFFCDFPSTIIETPIRSDASESAAPASGLLFTISTSNNACAANPIEAAASKAGSLCPV